jgi:membrane dipeptidase
MHYLLCSEEEKPTLDHFLKVVKYIEELVGVDHIAIAPDVYADGTWPKERWKVLYPNSDAFETYDKWPLAVTQTLVHAGYSDQEISKILGGNWLRLYKKVWKN